MEEGEEINVRLGLAMSFRFRANFERLEWC